MRFAELTKILRAGMQHIWALGPGPWTVCPVPWALCRGPWALGRGPCALYPEIA
jgi:hypothetical protein